MFDKTYYEQVINIKPAVHGLIQQSCPFSRFCRCHVNSESGQNFLDANPMHLRGGERKGVTVLQIMMLDENYMLIEYVFNDDIEKKE